jgi:hypothetical protein
MFRMAIFLFFILLFFTPFNSTGQSSEDIGIIHVRQNYLLDRRPGGFWKWRVVYCGKLLNKSETDTLRVTPVVHVTKGSHEITTEGDIGWGRLISPCACGVDSTFEFVLPGEDFWFGVTSDSVVTKNYSGLFSWVEFVVE